MHLRKNQAAFNTGANIASNLSERHLNRSFDGVDVPQIEPSLDELIARALRRRSTIEREVKSKSGHEQLLRIRPYKTPHNRIDGVLITLVDIESVKPRATAIVETIREPLLVLDARLRVLFANAAFCKTFQVPARIAEGISLSEFAKGEWDLPELRAHVKDVLRYRQRFEGLRVERKLSRSGKKIYSLSGQEIADEGKGTNTVLIVFQDITERESESLEVQAALTKRLREEKEQTEKRVAHELHDLSSEGFASINLEMARLATIARSAPNEVEQGLYALTNRVGALAKSTHELARRLHPSVLDDLGLVRALKDACAAFAARTAIPVRYRADELPKKLSEPAALCLYRVAQEALRNIATHAKATKAEVALSRAHGRVSLIVRDNGIGFDPASARAKGRLGLIGIAERVAAVGGTTSIASKINEGTTIEVILPLESGSRREGVKRKPAVNQRVQSIRIARSDKLRHDLLR